MDNDTKFKIFLFVSLKKFSILVIRKSNLEKIYTKEIFIDNFSTQIDFIKLDNFLDNHIFEIEKILKSFVKNIYLLVDCNDFFPIQISLKKENFGNLVSPNSLTYVLNEARDLCKKTLEKKKIIHLTIENYIIDNKYFSYLPKDLKCKNFSLDLKFICLSNDLIEILEQIFKRYQISLNRVISTDYIKKFLSNDENNIFNLSKKIIEDNFQNEVVLVSKNNKNQGFFEKFFNFFK